MADKVKEMGELMDNTLELMTKIEKTFPVEPMKCFDYVEKMADNFDTIKEINSDDENFDDDEVSDDFIHSLEKFIEVTEKYRQEEGSPYHTVLNKDRIMQILVDLERRYNDLTE